MARPLRYDFRSIEEVQDHLRENSKTDATFEGVVIRDSKNQRWKVKSPTYLGFHRMKGEEGFCPKTLLPFILAGEADELFAYFPEAEPKYREYSEVVQEEFGNLLEAMNAAQGIEDQKEYALVIQGRTKFPSLLFQLRKKHGTRIPESALKKKWSASQEAILKTLFKN